MEIITKYFPGLTPVQLRQFTELAPLYSEWNQKINVISRKDIDGLYERHILHSLSIAKFKDFPIGTKVLDIGTGGGFPGIPLAIHFPETSFHLVDSIGKKIKVVEGIAKAIGLKNLTAEHARAEQVKGKFDYVVSRAVAEMKEIDRWTINKTVPTKDWKSPNGIIFLKGGDLDSEIAALGRPVQVADISLWFKEPFFETKKIVFLER